MNDKQKAIILIVVIAALTGANGSIMKIGLLDIPPLTFAFLRFLLAGIIIIPFLFKKNFIKAFLQLIPVSLLGAINIIFFILGLKVTTATISQLLYTGVPLLTAIFLFVLFKERIARNKKVGIMIGFLGVILVVLLPILEKGTQFSGTLLGNLLISGGVIVYSLYNIYSKKKQKIYSPFIITATFIWTTLLALLPLFLWELTLYSSWWNSLSLSSIFSLIYVAIISTIFIFLLIQYSLKHGGAILASMQFYLAPIFAYVFAYLILGERLTMGLVVGGTLALLGIYITTKK